MVKFEGIVRKNGGVIQTGKINSIKLNPLINKKVQVNIKEIKNTGCDKCSN